MIIKEAEIDFRLDRHNRQFGPGDFLTGSYRVLRWQSLGLTAVEFSVLWHTIGKGDEDIGVIHFHRTDLEPTSEADLANPQLFSVELPPSPLSYEGIIVKVEWMVRLRLFYERGREERRDVVFRLGEVPAASVEEGEAVIEE